MAEDGSVYQRERVSDPSRYALPLRSEQIHGGAVAHPFQYRGQTREERHTAPTAVFLPIDRGSDGFLEGKEHSPLFLQKALNTNTNIIYSRNPA